jgi:glycosyltransferase involved in cell wall biosynthesis
VASQFQARRFDLTWCASFAAAQNYALDRAIGDWIFWLDSDDRLDDGEQVRLREDDLVNQRIHNQRSSFKSYGC